MEKAQKIIFSLSKNLNILDFFHKKSYSFSFANRPELFSSPRFRIQGGGTVSVTEDGEGQRTEILVSNIGYAPAPKNSTLHNTVVSYLATVPDSEGDI